MPRFQNADLGRLARVLAALRNGSTITLDPIETSRGTMSEHFTLGRYQADRDLEILQSVTMVSRSGRNTTSRFEPLDWSLDDLMSISAHFPEGNVAALPSLDTLKAEPWLEILTRLDTDGRANVAGTPMMLETREPDADNPCQIRIAFVGNGQWTAGELASHGR